MVSLLFAGCAPAYLMIKEADLHQIEMQIQEQEERLQRLAGEQVDLQSVLLESHNELLHQLQGIAAKQSDLMQRQQEWEKFIRSTRAQSPPRKKAEPVQQNLYAMVPRDKQLIGSVEKIFLSPPGAVLPARIDTGAATSSLDARNIEQFERNGERWVRFTVVNPEDGSEITLEEKLVRNVRIIQAVVDESERRPVVELGVTVGQTTQTAQFTLSDRRHLEFPVLIGRNILMDVMVVDVGKSHIAPPQLPAELSD